MIDPTNRYGFVREVEADLIDSTLDTLKRDFGRIDFMEVGVMGAGTVRGVYRRAKEIDCPVQSSGVDFEKYRPNPTPDANYKFYAGDSMEAWRNIPAGSKFNFLFVDGCHCVIHAMCDFLNYSPFVEVGGRVLFHDTALPTEKYDQEPWPQDHSYAGINNSKLGVREGLKKLGLLQGHRADWKLVKELSSDNGLMGMVLIRKEMEL